MISVCLSATRQYCIRTYH